MLNPNVPYPELGFLSFFFLAQVRLLKKKLYLCIQGNPVFIHPLRFHIIQWTHYYVSQ